MAFFIYSMIYCMQKITVSIAPLIYNIMNLSLLILKD